MSGKTTTQDLQINRVLKMTVKNWVIDSNTNITNNQRMNLIMEQKHFLKAGVHLQALIRWFYIRNGQAGTELLNTTWQIIS